jgi:hypothetical protein
MNVDPSTVRSLYEAGFQSTRADHELHQRLVSYLQRLLPEIEALKARAPKAHHALLDRVVQCGQDLLELDSAAWRRRPVRHLYELSSAVRAVLTLYEAPHMVGVLPTAAGPP